MGAEVLSSRAIIGAFYNRLEAALGSSWIGLVSNLFQSDQASETYKWLGMVPALREWIGGKQAKGFRDNGLTIINKEFEGTLEVPKKWLRRDKTGQLLVRINELADRAVEHWTSLISTLISNGTGSTNGLCYDGQFFFDSDHSEGASGTLKNLLTSAEVPKLDIATATAPTAIEAIDAILGVIAYMMTYKDDQGEPFNANATSWLIMTSPVLWAYMSKGIYGTRVNSGESNQLQEILQASGMNIQMVANPRLSYTTQFVCFRTDAPAKAMIRQEEDPISMKYLGEGSDHTFDTGNYKYSAEATRNVGYGFWQYAAHCTFS